MRVRARNTCSSDLSMSSPMVDESLVLYLNVLSSQLMQSYSAGSLYRLQGSYPSCIFWYWSSVAWILGTLSMGLSGGFGGRVSTVSVDLVLNIFWKDCLLEFFNFILLFQPGTRLLIFKNIVEFGKGRQEHDLWVLFTWNMWSISDLILWLWTSKWIRSNWYTILRGVPLSPSTNIAYSLSVVCCLRNSSCNCIHRNSEYILLDSETDPSYAT